MQGAVTRGNEATDAMAIVAISGMITLTDDLTVVNDVYFNAEVTIGDASTVTLNRTAIVASNSVTGAAVFNGVVTLGRREY